MSHGQFNEADRAVIREIAREMIKEFEKPILEKVELKAWRALGKLVLATGIVSSMATLLVKEAIEHVMKVRP